MKAIKTVKPSKSGSLCSTTPDGMTRSPLLLITAGLTVAIIMTGTIAAFAGTTEKAKNIEAGHYQFFTNPLGVNRHRKEDRLITPEEVAMNSLII